MADIPEPEYSIIITARLLIMTAVTNASSPLKICLESSSPFVFITVLSSRACFKHALTQAKDCCQKVFSVILFRRQTPVAFTSYIF